jgi:xanthine/CO dehydrogenase XdhC/CoxF family maturation factor
MDRQSVAIDIIRDGKRYAYRTWSHVPRVGDVIQLDGGKVHVEVERVVWADDDQRIHNCWAQLLCKTVKNIRANGKSKTTGGDASGGGQ